MHSKARAAWLGVVAGAFLTAGARAQEAQPADFTPERASDYTQIAGWPDFTGVWNPDWSILFGEGGRRNETPSLTPAAQEVFDRFQANQAEHGVAQEEQIACRPPGMPGIMRLPYPIEFVYSPGRVTIFVETYSQARRIYVDGRDLPEDPDPLFNGSSVGRWEGDALIVETVGFSPLVNIAPGVPHGEQTLMQERIWMEAPDVLRIETTITDPDVLAEPFVQQLAFRKQPDWEIREYVCAENNRLVEGEGGANLDLGLDGEEDGEDPFGPLPDEE